MLIVSNRNIIEIFGYTQEFHRLTTHPMLKGHYLESNNASGRFNVISSSSLSSVIDLLEGNVLSNFIGHFYIAARKFRQRKIK